MDTGPCFNDPHPANKRVDMALVDVAATSIVVVGLISKGLGANALTVHACGDECVWSRWCDW